MHARRRQPPTATQAAQARRGLIEEVAGVLLSGTFPEHSDNQILRELLTLREASKARRDGRLTLGPHLAVRIETGRPAMIVVRHGDKDVSTRVPAVVGQPPEDNVAAILFLQDYVTGLLDADREKEKSRRKAEEIDVSEALHERVESLQPTAEKGTEEYRLQRNIWRKAKIFAEQLIEFFGGTTLDELDIDSGNAYKAYRSTQELKKRAKHGGALRDKKGNIRHPKPSSIYHHLSFFRGTLRWYGAKHKMGTTFEFEMPYFPKEETLWFTYDEFVRILLATKGIPWTGNDYRRKPVERNGRTVFILDPVDEKERAWLRPTYRFIMTYVTTGTRSEANRSLLWGFHSKLGCIVTDTEPVVIHRNGRRGRRSRTKPRKTSKVLAHVGAMFRKWRRADTAKGYKHLVIHDGRGNPVPNMEGRIRRVLELAGLEEGSGHKLKHTGVTLLGLAGFSLSALAEMYGTDEQTLADTYRHVPWDGSRSPQAEAERLGFTSIAHMESGSPESTDFAPGAVETVSSIRRVLREQKPACA